MCKIVSTLHLSGMELCKWSWTEEFCTRDEKFVECHKNEGCDVAKWSGCHARRQMIKATMNKSRKKKKMLKRSQLWRVLDHRWTFAGRILIEVEKFIGIPCCLPVLFLSRHSYFCRGTGKRLSFSSCSKVRVGSMRRDVNTVACGHIFKIYNSPWISAVIPKGGPRMENQFGCILSKRRWKKKRRWNSFYFYPQSSSSPSPHPVTTNKRAQNLVKKLSVLADLV